MPDNADLKSKLQANFAYASMIAQRQDSLLANAVNVKQSGISLSLSDTSIDIFIGLMAPLIYYLTKDKYNFYGVNGTANNSAMWVDIFNDLVSNKTTVTLTDTRFTAIFSDLAGDLTGRTTDTKAQGLLSTLPTLFKVQGSQAEQWYGLGTILTFSDIAAALNS